MSEGAGEDGAQPSSGPQGRGVRRAALLGGAQPQQADTSVQG